MKECSVRPIAILAACAVAFMGALPVVAPAVVHAQTTTTTTTTLTPELKSLWEKFKGSWTQTKGAVKEQWGKLTDDDLLEIEGRREKLVGKIQSRYGISHEQAEAQVHGWEQKQRNM
jgi:uncharacterized protein YjbJ (UPF0337 family)